jgi:hypothetical protein
VVVRLSKEAWRTKPWYCDFYKGSTRDNIWGHYNIWDENRKELVLKRWISYELAVELYEHVKKELPQESVRLVTRQ